MRRCAALVAIALLGTISACAGSGDAGNAPSEDSLYAAVATKALRDCGFEVLNTIYVREALYDDVLAVDYEGDPEFLSEEDKTSIRTALGSFAPVVFYADPSVVVDADWNLLPDRLVLLVGPLQEVHGNWGIDAGVRAGADFYVGWYPVNPDTGEVGDSPPITFSD